ncbi:C-C motif chemokine 9-like isoform X1 [Phyllostomus hastatus]|uniref:C-C motif chemokine 9-like isoform X1 n=1 Tax=Phyllostomus hastatus TaxID=9423 RepID=UPI001E68015C|nr:C-C motif chemokine 9-like isoform X1 [Phyllostomus hastatus]
MKIFAAAFLFLIFAAALGPPAQASQDGQSLPQDREFRLGIQVGTRVVTQRKGVHRPIDCCFQRADIIQCRNMRSYYRTGRGCLRPAVIFKNKWGQKVCANPQSKAVKNCIKKLN